MDLRQTPLAELARACGEETHKFQRGQPSDDRFCFELIRRAVCDQDHGAWEAVLAQYRGIVLGWVKLQRAARRVREDDDFWVSRTFERFWGAVGPERFGQFASLAALLKYLKMCVHSVVLDEVRARGPAEMEPLEAIEGQPAESGPAAPDAGELATDHVAGQELWDAIMQEVPDESERQVVYLSLALDLKPAEIQQRHPGRFPSVADVYRIKRNVLERLRRIPRIQRFLE